jgi:hypothetical protein
MESRSAMTRQGNLSKGMRSMNKLLNSQFLDRFALKQLHSQS